MGKIAGPRCYLWLLCFEGCHLRKKCSSSKKLKSSRTEKSDTNLWIYPYLELWGGSSYSEAIGRFPILKSRVWNFLAITYDKSSGVLEICDQSGNAVANVTSVELATGFSERLTVGYAYWPKQPNQFAQTYLKPNDAVSCLMVYKDVLSSDEISQLPGLCELTHTTQRIPTTTRASRTTTKKETTTTTKQATTGTTKPLPAITPWPRPDALMGYWPLNGYYGFQDIAGLNSFKESSNFQLTTGPFGDPETAMSAKSKTAPILDVVNPNLALQNSFTISFFFKKDLDTAGIFEFTDKNASPDAFQIRCVDGTDFEISANSETVSKVRIVQQKGAWTFVALVFDGSTEMLTFYSKHGLAGAAVRNSEIKASFSASNNGIHFGFASRWGEGFSRNEAVSCLMIHSEALTSAEIRQAHDACRIIHGTAPCGTPRLPLSPIPSSTSITALGKPGQFPFVASIRYGNIICSASIIDEFWLITSSQCFVESKDASLYTVTVGEQDLSAKEAHERMHKVAKLVFSDETPRAVVLVQVEDPIDFTNQYVNDACLFRYEMLSEIKLDETQFVFGWGKNGRQPLASSTLPRCIPGVTLSDSQCLQSWGQGNYTATLDYCFWSASTDKNVPCGGDEGSPLLLQAHANPQTGMGDKLVQVGVYYKRDTSCTAGKPALFANVAEYSNWIAETLACAIPGVSYNTCPQF